MAKYTSDYEAMEARTKVLAETSPEVISDFMKMHDTVCKDTAVSVKNKELIALGIAVCIRCHDCILAHVKASKESGATYEEIADAVNVAIMMGGGPSTAYGALALDIAKDLYN